MYSFLLMWEIHHHNNALGQGCVQSPRYLGQGIEVGREGRLLKYNGPWPLGIFHPLEGRARMLPSEMQSPGQGFSCWVGARVQGQYYLRPLHSLP